MIHILRQKDANVVICLCPKNTPENKCYFEECSWFNFCDKARSAHTHCEDHDIKQNLSASCTIKAGNILEKTEDYNDDPLFFFSVYTHENIGHKQQAPFKLTDQAKHKIKNKLESLVNEKKNICIFIENQQHIDSSIQSAFAELSDNGRKIFYLIVTKNKDTGEPGLSYSSNPSLMLLTAENNHRKYIRTALQITKTLNHPLVWIAISFTALLVLKYWGEIYDICEKTVYHPPLRRPDWCPERR